MGKATLLLAVAVPLVAVLLTFPVWVVLTAIVLLQGAEWLLVQGGLLR